MQYSSEDKPNSLEVSLSNPELKQFATIRFLTIILLVQTLEDQPEFLFMISEIMNELLKV